MHDQNNVLLALALSAVILIAWQYFFATFLYKEAGRNDPRIGVLTPHAAMSPQVQATQSEAVPPARQFQKVSRQDTLRRWPRIAIETHRLRGSISLRGGRIDDLSLVQYHETTDPKSPAIELLSPSGTSQPFYAEFGWVNASATTLPVPTSETMWRQVGSNDLRAVLDNPSSWSGKMAKVSSFVGQFR
jgi:YidC/Oxa1 family membrane protein insertase